MAKDPAILFYTKDFIEGVITLTMEERGQYITLLCLLHQRGVLTRREIDIAAPGVSEFVMEKFKVDKDGNYYSQRIKIETEKRARQSKRQSENAKKRWAKSHDTTTNECDGIATAMPLANASANGSANGSANEDEDGSADNLGTTTDAVEVIEMLNLKADRNFKPTAESHLRYIRARMNEGATIDDFNLVIEYQTAKWLKDDRMDQYLRPRTLFNSDKFQTYLDEARRLKRSGKTPRDIYQQRNDHSELLAIKDAILAEGFSEEGNTTTQDEW